MLIATAEDLRFDREIARVRTLTHKHVKPEPCVVCCDPKADAHHHDYFKPLDVIHLCPGHHKRLHVRLSKRGRGPTEAYHAARRAGRPAPVDAVPAGCWWRGRCRGCGVLGHAKKMCPARRGSP